VVRRVIARYLSSAALVVACVALAIGLAPSTAQAKPKGPAITAVQITAEDLPGGKVVIQQSDRDMFGQMLSEVSWLATATPQTSAPKSKALGPKYTVTLLAQNKAQQVYDLYPLATGGPRAHRAAAQPTGKKADGWFYGRLTMPGSLRAAGAPLKAKPDVVTGGIGGGTGADVVEDVDPISTANQVMDQMRRLFLLNGAVLVVILAGLAGIAFLIRRRV
jgi:hypothetical protein